LYTPRIYNTYGFSTATMFARTRLNVTLYATCLSCRIVVKFVPVDLKTTSSNSVSRFTIYFYLRTKFNMFTSNLPLLTSTETKATENICRVAIIFTALIDIVTLGSSSPRLHYLNPMMKHYDFLMFLGP